MRIDFHKWAAFKECPKKFYLKHIKREPPAILEDDYPFLYGNLVQKFFELYCNIWRFKTPYLFPEIIKERLKDLYDSILRNSTVDWSGPKVTLAQEEILERAYNDVNAIMHSPNQNYFLNTKSEITIEATLKSGNVINGRLDFLHKPPLSENLILIDGKGSHKIGKDVNKDQLLFYALLCTFQFKRLPQEAGFFYYQFNTYVPIEINSDILNEFRAKLSLDIKTMTSSDYSATPSAKSCKYCSYLPACIEGMKSKASRAKESKIEGLEGEGLIEFGF